MLSFALFLALVFFFFSFFSVLVSFVIISLEEDRAGSYVSHAFVYFYLYVLLSS